MRALDLNLGRAAGILMLALLTGCGSHATPRGPAHVQPTRTPRTITAPTPPNFPTTKPAPSMRPVPSPVHRMTPLTQSTRVALRVPTPWPTTAGRRTAQSDEPLPPPPATPQVHVPHAAQFAALQRLAWKERTHDGQVPGGCASLAGNRICVPAVAVDGKPISDVLLMSQMIDRPPGTKSVREAVAAGVFQRLLYLEARQSGIHATTAQGRTLAEGELAAYQKDRATRSLIPIPSGVSPRRYFLAPQTIDAYRVGIIIGAERGTILAHHHGTDADVFASWLQRVLPHYTVTVDGHAPAFSLPAALRAGYNCTAGGSAASC